MESQRQRTGWSSRDRASGPKSYALEMSEHPGTAAVVGGGIGGLTAAAGLAHRGWAVTLYEQADQLTPVGAGITLWPNALRALDHVGVGQQVRSVSGPQVMGGIRTPEGKVLLHAGSRVTGDLVVLRRPALIDVLRAHAEEQGVRIQLGVRVDAGDVRGGVTVGGHRTAFDLVVAADGIRSMLRELVFPELSPPRYAGFTTWRWVVQDRSLNEGAEIWGPGATFGYVPMRGGEIYVFAGAMSELEDNEVGLNRFADWPEPVGRLATDAVGTEVLRRDVWWLPKVRSHVRGRVVLLGDAAHAMPPNLGQGGCQAIEDAATLAAVADPTSLPESLTLYAALREPRTRMMQQRSFQMARLAMARNSMFIALRNRVLSVVPARLMDRSLDQMLRWEEPPYL